jgi:hypothetical protein
MQVCPPLRSFPKTMSATVWSCTCPLATMAGDLPPSSSVTGTRFAGRLHDGSSEGGASGEDEMIERQGGERGTIAVDDRDLLFREDLADHRREHGVRRGGELRRFVHDAVAGGDHGDDRHQ